MAAPLGSTNRANGKRFANAVKQALEEYEDDKVKRGEALREIARGLVADAIARDPIARKELADRLDGRPAQAIVGDDEHDPIRTLSEIVIRAVDAVDR
jgi:DNA-directed RNA polymerase subunit K/omega